ncbi:unnamed protein product [Paramecium sonneborni]|uniref:Large ribosomal subunit protein uL24c n=1 Tax=Paramecium sonneborni TaxID=65129 RepID=A0A8S1PGM4_9CILI|nr:unnamed protein product [Paramecium sonneborni]
MLKAFSTFYLHQQTPIAQFAKQITFEKWNVIKGDKVVVVSGKDSGKTGTILRVYRLSNEVLVQGINQKFKRKSLLDDPSGSGIQQITRPIHLSKIALIDPEKGKPTKVQRGFLEDGTPVRVSKLSGSIIPKVVDPAKSPAHRHKNKVDGIKDTSPALALQVTYKGEDFSAIKAEFEQFIAEKEKKEELLWFDK